jgi:succinylglutamate desuccinylase
MKPMKRVLIFGGTHGNEWTGVYLVKNYARALQEEFRGLELHFIFSNPEAFALNRRFKDEDLNRSFQFLHESRTTYEHQRAKELKTLIDGSPCFVIDLHTTTSNMGKTIIVSQNQDFNLEVCARVQKDSPDTKIILSPDPHKKFLASQSPFGLMIEVGPVANCVLDPRPLMQSLEVLKASLRAIEESGKSSPPELEVFEEIEDLYYPKNEKGEIHAFIHPSFQNQDFSPLEGKYTPFLQFDGKEIFYEAKETLYPIFINEAAYYPQKLAFTLCRKKKISLR